MSSEPQYRDEGWLREQYVQKRRTSTDIAEECGCNSSTVLTWLNKFSVETRSRGSQPPHTLLTDAEWLREHYVQKNQTASEIAEELDCSPSAVFGWLDKHEIERRDAKRRLSEQRLSDEDWLHNQYIEQGFDCSEIAKKCECTADTVRRWLHRHGIEVGPRGGDAERKAADSRLTDGEWVREQYVTKQKRCVEIANEIGCSPAAVQTWVNKHSIDTDPHRYERADERLTDSEWLREQYVEQERTGYGIAEDCECGFGVVYEWLRRHDIESQYNGDRSGENHPQYAGGTFPYGPGWNESKRQTVRDRDDHTCQDPRCSVTQAEHLDEYGKKLHVHHLRKARDVADPEERNATENLITLCRDCHQRWEKIADAGLVPEVRR